MLFQFELAPEARVLQDARNALDAWCTSMQTDAESIIIIANELCTNAIRHGQGPVLLSCHGSQNWLAVSIRQRGRLALTMRTHPSPDELSTSGRGLLIVDCLSESWGWRTDADQSVVWARMARKPA